MLVRGKKKQMSSIYKSSIKKPFFNLVKISALLKEALQIFFIVHMS